MKRKRSRSYLEEVFSKYLTNGMFDTCKSEIRAFENKKRIEKMQHEKAKDIHESIMVFRNFEKLIQKIPLPEEELI